MKQHKIILASSSPRRIEMLKANGFEPIVIRPNINEDIETKEGPEDMVMKLAYKKAKSVEAMVNARYPNESCIIIGADTTVFFNEIIGKPKNKEDAFRILSLLKGKEHSVATGVALLNTETKMKKVFCVITKVGFKDYSDEEILSYIETDEPYDKAGGYAIQGGWGKNVAYISGDYDNVVGFPWKKIEAVLDLNSWKEGTDLK